MRIPVIKRLSDGEVVDGTCEYRETSCGRRSIGDFRDLDGNKMKLRPGEEIEAQLPEVGL